MEASFGFDAGAKKRGETIPVTWNEDAAINGHGAIFGMTGSGKTHRLRELISQMSKSSIGKARFHIFDVHGDISLPGASSVLFSEQTAWGINPLKVNPDPHFGGLRKCVQDFISTINRVMHNIGPKQEAALRNLVYDVFARYGFKQDDPSTWVVGDDSARLISDGSDGRLYLDVPLGEKDDAKALGARWDAQVKCWWIPTGEYAGGITRWPPKTLTRTHPSVADLTHYARHVLQMSFLGTGISAVSNLEAVNKAAAAYHRKLLEALRRGDKGFVDEKLEDSKEKAKIRAIDAFIAYAESISTGRELADVLKYDSTEVLKSVVDRLENLIAIGIFKSTPPPFDHRSSIWHYNITPLRVEERKLFVFFRLAEIFAAGVQRGEQEHIHDVIILDEAGAYADEDPKNIINILANESRKFGISLFCASQNPAHFSEDFLSAVATKIILGIDEMHWGAASRKMRAPEEGLKWIKPRKSALVQIKTKGDSKSDWKWVVF